MAPGRVLVVEDDRATRESLRLALSLAGYDVEVIADGSSALERARERFDAIVLDVSLPFVDGLSVCRKLRADRNGTPILMLSARVSVSDRVQGLDAGADDYLVKPFAVEELLARVRAIARRLPAADAGEQIESGPLRIDAEARRAFVGGSELDLTRTEFDLLLLLARNAGLVLPHGVIYERVWGPGFDAGSKSLPVYIGYLRRKLACCDCADLIRTVRGIGYTMRGPSSATGRPAVL